MNSRAEARNNFQMPRRAYFHPYSTARVDTMDHDGTNHASIPQRIKEDLLDRYDITYAILMGNDLTTLSGMPDPDLAAAIARAYSPERSEGSRMRSGFNMIAASSIRFGWPRKIRFRQQPKLTAGAGIPMWCRWRCRKWISWQAIATIGPSMRQPPATICRLASFHVGAESAGNNGPQIKVGARTYYIELQTGVISIGIQNTISLVCQGVFERFPNLKIVLLEYGWTWIPGLMWRLDREWKSLRAEVPWVIKPPSDYIREHIRVGSQPLEVSNLQHLHQTLEMMSAEKMMVFATDYPHWDFDDPSYVMARLPKHMRKAIAYENARALYGL